MKLNVAALPQAQLLSSIMPEHFSRTDGVEIRCLCNLTEGYVVEAMKDGSIRISHAEVSGLICALGDVLAGDYNAQGKTVKKLALGFRGLMMDCSRNAVPKLSFLKRYLLTLALMGMNYFCLYTEDTYQVEDEPLFGYGRGAFSNKQIRELVEYGEDIGVTLFPCMQTLGHMEQILKYDRKYIAMQDTPWVINIKNEDTYEFLEKIINNCVQPYNTKLIHLGMDEPWGLGRGLAFTPDVPINPGRIYAEHVSRMAKYCEQCGLQPIIWGDFVLGRSGDKPLTHEELASFPKSLIMDYWNYYDRDPEIYNRHLEIFQKNGYAAIASPATWSWNRYWVKQQAAKSTIDACMAAVYSRGVDKALITLWGDDGAECLFDSNLAVLAYFLEWTRGAKPEDARWQARLEAISGLKAEYFDCLAALEYPLVNGSVEQEEVTSTSRILFYDDPLYGYFNRMYADKSIADYYAGLSAQLDNYAEQAVSGKTMLLAAAKYAAVIAGKFRLNYDARAAYKAADKSALTDIVARAAQVAKVAAEFHKLYKQLWLNERVPFGLEVLDVRIGGVTARLDTFGERLTAYITGDVACIDEFDIEHVEQRSDALYNAWSKIYTKCHMVW